MLWREKLLSYRERFRRLDRKWHVLIGSQILFGLVVLRVRNQKHLFQERETEIGNMEKVQKENDQ